MAADSRVLITTHGALRRDDVTMMLAHEHLFVDLGPIEAEAYRSADVAEAVALMTPYLRAVRAQGIDAFVECTPVGVGRRADIDVAIAQAANMPVLLPTGVYREPWVPEWVHAASQDALTDWMLHELTVGIEETGVRAAWIKVSAGDDGMTPVEEKILRAAARAARATGAIIGSHTIRGRVVLSQMDILDSEGCAPDRFIWIHTQAEHDQSYYWEAAGRGAWLEFDAIGSPGYSDVWFIEAIQAVLAQGFGRQLLLSHDRGWYDPSKPGGGTVRPFTYLVETFLPKLRASGVDAATLTDLVADNPFRAYARPDGSPT